MSVSEGAAVQAYIADLRARLDRAAVRLEERIEATKTVDGRVIRWSENARLTAKLDGLMQARSYL